MPLGATPGGGGRGPLSALALVTTLSLVFVQRQDPHDFLSKSMHGFSTLSLSILGFLPLSCARSRHCTFSNPLYLFSFFPFLFPFLDFQISIFFIYGFLIISLHVIMIRIIFHKSFVLLPLLSAPKTRNKRNEQKCET